MTELLLLRRKVAGVEFVGIDLDRHTLDDLQPVAFQTDNLLRIVRHQPHLMETEIDKDLRAESIVAKIGLEAERFVRFHRILTLILKRISEQLIGQPDATSFLTHVENDTPPLPLHLYHRR